MTWWMGDSVAKPKMCPAKMDPQVHPTTRMRRVVPLNGSMLRHLVYQPPLTTNKPMFARQQL